MGFAAIFSYLPEPVTLAVIGFVFVGLGLIAQPLILASKQRFGNQSKVSSGNET